MAKGPLRIKDVAGVAVRKLYLYSGDESDIATCPVVTPSSVGRLAGSIVAASTAITGATEADTAFDQSVSIPAGTLNAGSVIRIRASGVHTATTGSETHVISLKIGSVTVASFSAVDPANADMFVIDMGITVRTVGASGTIVGAGFGSAASASGAGIMKPLGLASTTLDTTGALSVAVWIDRQAAATDSDSARLDYLTVEILG